MAERKSSHPLTEPSVAWPTEASAYQLIEKIGQGGSSTVWFARCPAVVEECAVKVLDLESLASSLDDIRKEIQVMSQSKHPNVIRYHCSFVHERSLWLVMEMLIGGSVMDVMRFAYPEGFVGDEVLIATILKEALKGIEYFHQNGQIHRDVKAGNILLAADGSVKIADFGVSAWMFDGGEMRKECKTFVGTPCWMAPEVMEQMSGYDYKADIWSFGITAMELACGQAPFAKYPPMKVMLLTLNNAPPSLDQVVNKNRYSRSLKDLVAQCLQKDPTKRPSAAKLLEHKFFKNAKKQDIIVDRLLKKLPPLAERTKVLQRRRQLQPPSVEEDAGTEVVEGSQYARNTSWVFDEEAKKEIREIRTQQQKEKERTESSPREGSPESSTTDSAAPPPRTMEEHKGRFTIRCEAKPRPIQPSPKEKKGRFLVESEVVSSADTAVAMRNDKPPTSNESEVLPPRGASQESDVVQLQHHIQMLMRDKEDLQKENAELRRKLMGDGDI